jgi:hypothetical protein
MERGSSRHVLLSGLGAEPAGGGLVPPQGLVLSFGFETTSDQIDSEIP